MDIGAKALTLEEALRGKDIPREIRSTLVILPARYYGFDGIVRTGQLVVHEKVASDIETVFRMMFETRFPLAKVVPVSEYDWQDEESMQDNNTSAFNYRSILGTDRVSNHALGLAVDINPKINPWVSEDGRVQPARATYDTKAIGAICANGEIVKLFKSLGWKWGGDWTEPKDYQHFEKTL